jgi:hypothetical protein
LLVAPRGARVIAARGRAARGHEHRNEHKPDDNHHDYKHASNNSVAARLNRDTETESAEDRNTTLPLRLGRHRY